MNTMDPVFSSEYNKLLNSMDNIQRRIDATREMGSIDPEFKRCASSDALEQCHQRLLTIYLERLRGAVSEAVRDKASRELAAAPRDLAGPGETAPSPDVCDKVDPERPSSLRTASLDNDRRRVAGGGPLERAVSWKGHLEVVCIIPGRHDADVQGSAFTKRGHKLARPLLEDEGVTAYTNVGKQRKFWSKRLLAPTTIGNVKASSESAAAASRSGAKPAMGDIRRCKSAS